jgi:hypothetical protein
VERVDEFVDVGDPVLEQVADSSGSVAEKFHGVVGLDVLRQHQDTHVRVLGADLACCLEALVRVGGRHPDVDDHRVRWVGAYLRE